MEQLIPDTTEWAYNVKRALNERIYSNPLVMSDLIDIVHSELENIFGLNNITFFQYIDGDRTIKFQVKCNDPVVAMNNISMVHAHSLVRFCCQYKTAIEVAISDITGSKNADMFNRVLMHEQNTLINQLSLFFGHPIQEGNIFSATFRMF